jgi:hypothetical protein
MLIARPVATGVGGQQFFGTGALPGVEERILLVMQR